jgi:N-acetylmuramoyl-L-alanine amidase
MRSPNKLQQAVFLYMLCIVYSCGHNPYSGTNKQYKKVSKDLAKSLRPVPEVLQLDSIVSPKYAVGTTNFDLRKPNFVIIHHTAQTSCDQTLKTFTLERTKVSAHYVICKDGTVHHMLNDYLRAWQAGISKWGNFTDINSSSIGIELDNNGYEPFAEPLMISLIKLLDTLKKKYAIPAPNFIGHGDIAPTRKNDPNVFFPWKQLSERGFGLWYDDTTYLSVPVNFDRMQALRIIGYDMKDSIASIRSFRRHFLQDSTGRTINKAEDKILYTLYRKYL